MSSVIERLRQLAARVKAGPGGDEGAAQALAADAEELMREAEAFRGPLGPGELQEVIQEARIGIMSTAQAEPSAGTVDATLLLHVTAACRLGAAGKALLLLCGGNLKEPCNLTLTSGMLGLMLNKGSKLACAALGTGPAGGCEVVAAQLLQAQLQAMHLCLLTGADHSVQVGAYSPQQLASWLQAMTALLSQLQAAPGVAAVKGVLEQVQLCHLPSVCYTLAASAACAQLHPELQRGPLPGEVMAQLVPALSRLSVLLALPAERRPLGVTWAAARPATSLFYFAPLTHAVLQWFAAATGDQMVTLLAGAARLLAQLPTNEPPAGLPGGAAEHSGTAVSLCMCLGRLCKLAGTRLAWRAMGGAQRRRLKPALLAAIGQLPGALQLMAARFDVPEAPPAPGSHVLQLQPFPPILGNSMAVSAISSLPELLLTWMDDDASCGTGGQQQPVPLMEGIGDALPWARAAAAALRCGPALAAIDRRLEQLPAGRPQPQPETVSPGAVLQELTKFAGNAATALSKHTDTAGLPLPPGCPPLAEVQTVVWELHSAGCRFIHWCIADGWFKMGENTREARSMLWVLDQTLNAQAFLHSMEQDAADQPTGSSSSTGSSGSGGSGSGPTRTCRELEAMCAAHWPAVQALAAACDLGSCAGALGCSWLAVSLAVCMAKGPLSLATDADLYCMFRSMLGHISKMPDDVMTFYGGVFLAAERAPRLAALLVAGGHLEAMTGEVERLDARLSTTRSGQLVPGAWKLAIDALCGEARELLSRPGLEPETEGALRAAADALAGLLPQLQTVGGLPRNQQQRQPLLQALQNLAKALQQVWQLPEQQEAARLEAAQAAAARSCAYLRCANLGGGGGPAVGQGSGSSKCSACRVAWYCGEGCSHADWRGPTGHRKTCKALGAAKAARRQAAAEAAAEAAAAEAALAARVNAADLAADVAAIEAEAATAEEAAAVAEAAAAEAMAAAAVAKMVAAEAKMTAMQAGT